MFYFFACLIILFFYFKFIPCCYRLQAKLTQDENGQKFLDDEEKPLARFAGGTIVIDNAAPNISPPQVFQRYQGKWRCPAFHYRTVRLWLKEQGIRDVIPRWQRLSPCLRDDREPHPYQKEAVKAWLAADCWGSVVLPTGAGKTFVALQSIVRTAVSTLVVVPTVDLLHQWYACIENAFGESIGSPGLWYGLEKELRPLTITTYHSAWANAEMLGNQFKLLIFDEIHHLPAPSWHEIALMCAAPYRLGLTATYPDLKSFGRDTGRFSGVQEQQQSFGRNIAPAALLDEIVGPVVYRKALADLTGRQLAAYRTQRIRVSLSEQEQAAYDVAHAEYIAYIREARLPEKYGPAWWDEFTRRSAYDAQARKAKVAELKLKEIVHQAQAKSDVLDQLLREHYRQRMLIFTAHNRFAYRISRRHLIPTITHQTGASERKAITDSFQKGVYRAIVTTKVLNEGIDFPGAKIAVILGGSSGAREYIQRLGRILRKQGDAEAVLYEVIVRNTVDEGIARRRKHGTQKM